MRSLANEIQPEWISDHLCWTGANGINSHDLLPLPYTEEAIRHVCERIGQVQDFLGRQILIENVFSYLSYRDSGMPEWDSVAEVVRRADCRLLLDVNNIYVSARIHGFEPREYLDGMPADRIWQIHLAGHTDNGDHVIDTHDHDVCDSVWSLYRYTLQHFGLVSTMIERDDDIPPFPDLEVELMQARDIANKLALSDTLAGSHGG